jgi:hypothetical protein
MLGAGFESGVELAGVLAGDEGELPLAQPDIVDIVSKKRTSAREDRR